MVVFLSALHALNKLLQLEKHLHWGVVALILVLNNGILTLEGVSAETIIILLQTILN
jgi:hypothetical protein